ncbi:MAG: hypothetical protein LAO79_09840, partial [Acidobacteriia bacterium]|nr:hypothetical protein [Terriglobia bacterium]
PDLILIVDEISGLPGEHLVEQFWHLGSIEDRNRIVTEEEAKVVQAWRSEAFGARNAAVALSISKKCILPTTFGTAIHLGRERPCLSIQHEEGCVEFLVSLNQNIQKFRCEFPMTGSSRA